MLAGGHALIATAGNANAAWPPGVTTVALPDPDGRVDLVALLRALAKREINEVHVEAGAGLNGALLSAALVDELLLYLAPCMIGDPARGIAAIPGGLARLADRIPLEIHDVARIGDDLRVIAFIATKGD